LHKIYIWITKKILKKSRVMGIKHVDCEFYNLFLNPNNDLHYYENFPRKLDQIWNFLFDIFKISRVVTSVKLIIFHPWMLIEVICTFICHFLVYITSQYIHCALKILNLKLRWKFTNVLLMTNYTCSGSFYHILTHF